MGKARAAHEAPPSIGLIDRRCPAVGWQDGYSGKSKSPVTVASASTMPWP